jgi:hypothetical protein
VNHGLGRVVLIPLAAALGAGVLTALVLAIVDLYVTGHGNASLTRPWLEWGAIVQLSRADVILLAIAGAAGAIARITVNRAHSATREPDVERWHHPERP